MMRKICTYCGVERDAETDFSWEYKAQGIRQSRCKYCQREMSNRHYRENKLVYRQRDRIRKPQILAENARLIANYLSTHPCIDCGQKDLRLLEFDHVKDKKSYEVCDLFVGGYNWQKIEAE